jgi:hypothetical protein
MVVMDYEELWMGNLDIPFSDKRFAGFDKEKKEFDA